MQHRSHLRSAPHYQCTHQSQQSRRRYLAMRNYLGSSSLDEPRNCNQKLDGGGNSSQTQRSLDFCISLSME